MKKILFALAAVAMLSITACHYGQEEAQKTLERNEQYKGDKKEFSVNRANADAPAETVAPAEAAPADSTAK